MVSGMDIESRIFIDHEEKIIFIEDRRYNFCIETTPLSSFEKGSFFFLKSEYLIIPQVYIDLISRDDTIYLIYFSLVYLYFSRTKPLIYTSERGIRKVFFDKFIDTLISVRWRFYFE